SRWTHNLSEKYFGYAISIGVKLFTIYLIIGFGDSFTQALKDTIAAAYAAHPEGPSFGDYLGLGGASLFYGVTGYMAPGLAGSMLNGTVAMSLQSAGTAAGMVGGAPVAAGLATSAAGARALGLAGSAVGALMPVQKAAGAIAGSSGSAFGGGISGAINPTRPFQNSTPQNAGGTFGGSGTGGRVAGSGGTGGRGAGSNWAAGSGPATNGALLSQVSPSTSAPTRAGQGNSSASPSLTQNQTPGFVDARFGDTRFDASASPGSGRDSDRSAGQNSSSMADSLNRFSKRLQYAADRRKPHWVHDGQVGHAPGLRMGLDA
ncbi:MAG: hypothetical protein RLZZ591_2964, partial [Pseudomonadota bacterium]